MFNLKFYLLAASVGVLVSLAWIVAINITRVTGADAFILTKAFAIGSVTLGVLGLIIDLWAMIFKKQHPKWLAHSVAIAIAAFLALPLGIFARIELFATAEGIIPLTVGGAILFPLCLLSLELMHKLQPTA